MRKNGFVIRLSLSLSLSLSPKKKIKERNPTSKFPSSNKAN